MAGSENVLNGNNDDDRRLWIGNLDTRLTEFQLLKILQKFGTIEKFDILFHKSGKLVGQPRGYAFVTFEKQKSSTIALEKLNGKQIGAKSVIVRLAKHMNMNYNDLEKPRPKVDIPVLAAGSSSSSSSSSEPKKMSKEITIQAIEAKLKMLENKTVDFEINKTTVGETPIIQRYQFNKLNLENRGQNYKYHTKQRYSQGPYNKRHKK